MLEADHTLEHQHLSPEEPHSGIIGDVTHRGEMGGAFPALRMASTKWDIPRGSKGSPQQHGWISGRSKQTRMRHRAESVIPGTAIAMWIT